MFRTGLIAAGIVLTLAAPAARAASVENYTPAAFAAAQQAGKPILVHITAPWCPTCAAQRPILARLEDQPGNRDLRVFNVDFDHQKDAVRAFGARMQSTLIVFHGAVEEGRSTGDTRADSIEALVARANG
jgi:thiol-disulfide isomerase/thioredoxin